MKRIPLASLLVLLLLTLLWQHPASAIDSGPSANGDFQFSLEDGNTRYIQFDARTHGDKSRGTMTFSDPAGTVGDENTPNTTTGIQVTADFDCLRIEGNRAVMGGAISSSNILAAIGHRVLLVVEDNGEGVGTTAPDRLTWGIYDLPATGWTAKDAERDDDNGAALRWIARDFERSDDVGIPSHTSGIVGCQSFSLASYSFTDVAHGGGNIQIRP
jgi:hypothetical protein